MIRPVTECHIMPRPPHGAHDPKNVKFETATKPFLKIDMRNRA